MDQETALTVTPNQHDKIAIIRECLGLTEPEARRQQSMVKDYMAFYGEQMAMLGLRYGPTGNIWILPIPSHLRLIKVLQIVKTGSYPNREELRRLIKSEFKSALKAIDELTDAVIDVCLRLWLMINFRCSSVGGYGGDSSSIEWEEGVPLASKLSDLFPRSTTDLSLNQRHLSAQFTVACMVEVSGLKVRWTSSLVEHLRLDCDQKTLWIFPHQLYLQQHAKSTGTARTGLPANLYEEAIKTLDLLFPSKDEATKRLLKKHGKVLHTVGPSQRELDLRRFSFWRDRLLELDEFVFRAPSEDWRQLWCDRRDPQKFWTFWIASMIFVLTIASTVASIVQTWATLQSLKRGA